MSAATIRNRWPSPSHGMEKNPKALAAAKMAECILAIALEVPVQPVLDAPALRPWDVRAGRWRIDVKRTGLSGGYLIWPIRKNDLFAGKDFDLLVLVKNDWNVGFPRGWLEKAEFSRLKEVAGEGHKLDPGTWHVGEDRLRPMSGLPGFKSTVWAIDEYFDVEHPGRAERRPAPAVIKAAPAASDAGAEIDAWSARPMSRAEQIARAGL